MSVLRTVHDTLWVLCLLWVVVQAALLEVAGACAHVEWAVGHTTQLHTTQWQAKGRILTLWVLSMLLQG